MILCSVSSYNTVIWPPLLSTPFPIPSPGYRTAQLDDLPQGKGGSHTRPKAKDVVILTWDYLFGRMDSPFGLGIPVLVYGGGL